MWGANVEHGHYHHRGNWYHVFERFPAALFDPNGYIRFETEEEYRSMPGIRHGKHINVTPYISALPGYTVSDRPGPSLTAS